MNRFQISFEVSPGEKVGVVGRTGAGKSTLCLALSRIVELQEGAIEIDGEDISGVDLQALRKCVTVIPQDPALFSGTLKFNLDPFDREPDIKLEELLHKAGLDDLLERVDEAKDNEKEKGKKNEKKKKKKKVSEPEEPPGRGLYFKLKENGSNLSSGEKQLICICRAIL